MIPITQLNRMNETPNQPFAPHYLDPFLSAARNRWI
jgi:hypothetical protein